MGQLPYLRRLCSTLSASLLNSPQSGTFHYLSTFLHIHSIGLRPGEGGSGEGRSGGWQEKGQEEERMKGDRAKGQKKEKSMGMLVRDVGTKCEYKR